MLILRLKIPVTKDKIPRASVSMIQGDREGHGDEARSHWAAEAHACGKHPSGRQDVPAVPPVPPSLRPPSRLSDIAAQLSSRGRASKGGSCARRWKASYQAKASAHVPPPEDARRGSRSRPRAQSLPGDVCFHHIAPAYRQSRETNDIILPIVFCFW